MGKAKEKQKELSDIMGFPIINRLDVTDENRLKVAREVNQQLYDGLLSVKGADYLRERGIIPLEQWSSDNFWKKSSELSGYYQKEYNVQQEAQFKKWKKRSRRWEIVFLGMLSLWVSGYAVSNAYLRERNDVRMRAEKAKADHLYCQSLLLKAQSEETKAFVNREVTAPYSGRLCELVLAEGIK